MATPQPGRSSGSPTFVVTSVNVPARPAGVTEEDVVPAVVVEVDCRDARRGVLDKLVLRRCPLRRLPQRVVVRLEVEAGCGGRVREAAAVACHRLTVEHLLGANLPLPVDRPDGHAEGGVRLERLAGGIY